MEIIPFLKQQIEARFVANSAITALYKKIEEKAKRDILEKYKDKILTKDGLEYELFDADCNIYEWSTDIKIPKIPKVTVRLIYFCVSKLPKNKKIKLQKVQREYEESSRKWLPYNRFKVPLWYDNVVYHIPVNLILEKKINLKIDFQ